MDFAPDQRVRVRQRPDLPPGTVTRTVRYRSGILVHVLHDDGTLHSWWARDLAPVVPELPPEFL